MKKLVSFLGMAIAALFMSGAAFAQEVEEKDPGYFYIYKSGTLPQSFYEGDSWSMTFSAIDSLNNEYNTPVNVYLNGGKFGDSISVELQTIDSIVFYQPKPVVRADVFVLDLNYYDYIVDVDTAKIVFLKTVSSCLSMPEVGEKIVSFEYKDPLICGLTGIVEGYKVVADSLYLYYQSDWDNLIKYYSSYNKEFSLSELLGAETGLTKSHRRNNKSPYRKPNKVGEDGDDSIFDIDFDTSDNLSGTYGPITLSATLNPHLKLYWDIRWHFFADNEDGWAGAIVKDGFSGSLGFKINVTGNSDNVKKRIPWPDLGYADSWGKRTEGSYSSVAIGAFFNITSGVQAQFDWKNIDLRYEYGVIRKLGNFLPEPYGKVLSNKKDALALTFSGSSSLTLLELTLEFQGSVKKYIDIGLKGTLKFPTFEFKYLFGGLGHEKDTPGELMANYEIAAEKSEVSIGGDFSVGFDFTFGTNEADVLNSGDMTKFTSKGTLLKLKSPRVDLDKSYSVIKLTPNTDYAEANCYLYDKPYEDMDTSESTALGWNLTYWTKTLGQNFELWAYNEDKQIFEDKQKIGEIGGLNPLFSPEKPIVLCSLRKGDKYSFYPVMVNSGIYMSAGHIKQARIPYSCETKQPQTNGWHVKLNAVFDESFIKDLETNANSSEKEHQLSYGFQYAKSGEEDHTRYYAKFTDKLSSANFTWELDYNLFEYEQKYWHRAFICVDGEYFYGDAIYFTSGVNSSRPIFHGPEKEGYDSVILDGEISDKLYEELVNSGGSFKLGFECYPKDKAEDIKSVYVNTVNTAGTYSAELNGLIQDTEYQGRAVAIINGKTFTGTEGAFRTGKAYQIIGFNVDPEYNEAMVTFKVTDYVVKNNVTAYVSWSENNTFPSDNTLNSTAVVDSEGNARCTLHSMKPLTTYYCKLHFENNRENIVAEGVSIESFVTKDPYVLTISEPETSFSKTTFKAEITKYLAESSEEKSGKFYYARKASDLGSDKCKSVDAVFVDGNMEVTGEVKTLDYNTTYNYKFVLTAGGKDWESDVVTFKTPDPYSVSTKDTSHPDNDKWSTSLNGSITSVALDMYKNNQGNLQVYFEYATEQFFFDEDRADVIYAPIEGTTVTATPKLLYNTQYLYRIVLDANGTKHKGSIKKCKTCDIMQCETGEATATEECVTIKGWISPEAAYTSTTTTTNSLGQQEKIHSVTAYIDYSDEEAMHNPKSIAVDFDTETGDFSKDIYTMEYDTTYYYRTRLVIDGQEVKGELKSVKTLEYDPGQIVDKNKKR